MSGFYLILPTLLTVFISLLIVRGGAIALRMTGLEEKKAKFQALSAFTGSGFTTRETELVVNHPKRRQIISWLMILGNAGIVTVIITTTSSLSTSKGYELPFNFIILILGLFLIYRIANRKGFTKKWEDYVEKRLLKIPAFDEALPEELLRLNEGYGLVKVTIRANSPYVNGYLSELKLTDKGLLVLSIERNEQWVTIPKAKEQLFAGDKVIFYGPIETLNTIFKEKYDLATLKTGYL